MPLLIPLGHLICRSICTTCWSKLQQILLLPIPKPRARSYHNSYEFFLQRTALQLQEERLIDHYDLVNAVLGKMIQNMGFGR